ncbi:adenosylmethionine decarboxylase [Thalassotalea sediminis]|uniref:adenosylmethionine decarboxylase n=1 Tax=Thalassotalea sediminis TaxID=1759089 RepID=UPI0025732070|nr:adenosylmethionine decarboxylase [Thalassotalea sediminis]
MFFEGSVKKAEIIVAHNNINLLTDFDEAFWRKLVACCEAHILSSIKNDVCHAYLLSESSLFVWSNRLLILTCGTTSLVKSVEFFLQNIDAKQIKHLLYQRKNEYLAHAQSSYFGQDINQLQQYVNGKAMRFGHLDSHHNYVYHLINDYVADPIDKTYELLAYQISDNASHTLSAENITAKAIRSFLQLDKLIPQFDTDDFVFDPYGYSLNAINNNEYFTIHVTPQAGSSYISFESNLNLILMAPAIIAILEPNSIDVLTVNEQSFDALIKQHVNKCYVRQSIVSKTLDNGYLMHFANFIRPQIKAIEPVDLDVSKDHLTL